MTTHAMEILHSSVESDWRTPDPCFQALHEEFRFQIDAAAHRPGSWVFEVVLSEGWMFLPITVGNDMRITRRNRDR
jgi:hypothetical protein